MLKSGCIPGERDVEGEYPFFPQHTPKLAWKRTVGIRLRVENEGYSGQMRPPFFLSPLSYLISLPLYTTIPINSP